MKVLQLYHKMPFPMHDGGACSIYSSSLSILSQGINLKILAMDTMKAPGDIDLMPVNFLKKTRLESVTVDNRVNLFHAFWTIFSHVSYFAKRFYSTSFKHRLVEILKQEDFDIIQLEHLYLCHYLVDIRRLSKAKVILRAQNVEYRVWKEYSRKLKHRLLQKYLGLEVLKLERFERHMASQVDGIMALTKQDEDFFMEANSKAYASTIPMGIDFSCLAKTDNTYQYMDFPIVYHLGSMDWRPNSQGLKWFIEKVFPLVLVTMPNIRICIAGRNMPGWFIKRNSRNLIVESVVEDATTYQKDKAIMIVPLLSGSGIRVKILQGMALGKTIISTSVGAQGISAINNESIIIADSPEEFAKQICRCAVSESLCRKIGENARKAAMLNYEVDSIGIQMNQFYQIVLSEMKMTLQEKVA